MTTQGVKYGNQRDISSRSLIMRSSQESVSVLFRFVLRYGNSSFCSSWFFCCCFQVQFTCTPLVLACWKTSKILGKEYYAQSKCGLSRKGQTRGLLVPVWMWIEPLGRWLGETLRAMERVRESTWAAPHRDVSELNRYEQLRSNINASLYAPHKREW